MESLTHHLIESLPALPAAKKPLIILDVQNDSLYHKDGNYLVESRDIIPRLKELIPLLRQNTCIFWTCKLMEKGSLYQEGTKGAEIHCELLDVLDKTDDPIVFKNHDSAFKETSLLIALRKEMFLDVYLSGCLTDTAIYSTAADAMQHGFHLHLIEDCLGYREEERHRKAMKQMIDQMGVDIVSSKEIKDSYLKNEWTDVGRLYEELCLNTHKDTTIDGS